MVGPGTRNMRPREGTSLTMWDARSWRPASVRGTGIPLLLKHSPEVLNRAHGCRLGSKRPESSGVLDRRYESKVRRKQRTRILSCVVDRARSSSGWRDIIETPLLGAERGATELPQAKATNEWKWRDEDECWLECAWQRTGLRKAERGGDEGRRQTRLLGRVIASWCHPIEMRVVSN